MNYTAEEVRARLGFVISDREPRILTWESGGCHPASIAECALWDALAERIEADESTMPAATACADHAKGEIGYCIFHTQVSWGTKLFAHPPAQAVQVDAFADRLRQSIMRDTFQPTADPVAQGDASLGRCKACGRATRAVCDGLDGNGLGCTNASPINLAAIREVIESHINDAKNLRHDPELHDYLYEQADKLTAALQEKGNG